MNPQNPNFTDWLLSQNWKGKIQKWLVDDIQNDPEWPRGKSDFDYYYAYLVLSNANRKFFVAFRDLWFRWCGEKGNISLNRKPAQLMHYMNKIAKRE